MNLYTETKLLLEDVTDRKRTQPSDKSPFLFSPHLLFIRFPLFILLFLLPLHS